MKTKLKQFFQTKVGKVIISILRGTVIRSVPGGNAIIDAVENEIVRRNNKKGGTDQKELPHSWHTIVAEIVGVGLVIYAFYNKLITIDQLKIFIEYILTLVP